LIYPELGAKIVDSKLPVIPSRRSANVPANARKAEAFARAVNPPTSTEVQSHSLTDHVSYDLPTWQYDIGFQDHTQASPVQERGEVIKSLVATNRIGIILDVNLRALQGTPGWVANLRAMSTLRFHDLYVGAVSKQSQSDLERAIARLDTSPWCQEVSIVLNDLDGWAADVMQIRRVGTLNPDCVLLLLPKTGIDLARTIGELGDSLGLTKKQVTIVKKLLGGRIESEIAHFFRDDIKTVTKSISTILRKFRVRQKSDLIRLFTRLP
jgi:DNA-binding CsgD family transcriptional regulator